MNALGYPVGPIDGVLDAVTANAIRTFQRDAGLPITGAPDQALIGLLFGGTAGQGGDANPANDSDSHRQMVMDSPILQDTCVGGASGSGWQG